MHTFHTHKFNLGILGCIEHLARFGTKSRHSKRKKIDLHGVWLDLANAYGSVSNKLIELLWNSFKSQSVRNIISRYFNNLHMASPWKTIQQDGNNWNVGLPWDIPSPKSCLLQPLR